MNIMIENNGVVLGGYDMEDKLLCMMVLVFYLMFILLGMYGVMLFYSMVEDDQVNRNLKFDYSDLDILDDVNFLELDMDEYDMKYFGIFMFFQQKRRFVDVKFLYFYIVLIIMFIESLIFGMMMFNEIYVFIMNCFFYFKDN